MSISVAVMVAMLAAGCGRNDAAVTDDVKAKLAADEMVKGAAIQVDTKDGVVTLSGTVDSQAVKDRAVTLARQTERVEDVADQITVKEPASTTGTWPPGPGRMGYEGMERRPGIAGDIANVVRERLRGDPTLGKLDIRVETRDDGTLFLSGQVRSEAERARVLELARETTGGHHRVEHNIEIRR